MTSLPLYYTFLKDDQAIWQNDSYDQWTNVDDREFYASIVEPKSGVDKGGHARTYWESNFIPDAVSFDQLDTREKRGGGGRSVYFPFRGTSFFSHISEFASGRYKKAHRHVGGANIEILSGRGYSHMWIEGDDEPLCIDWNPYSLFAPPTLWYHQHFNTTDKPARYMALHGPAEGLVINDTDTVYFMDPRNQIEYHDEDPEIREQFVQELEANGVEFRMDEDIFAN